MRLEPVALPARTHAARREALANTLGTGILLLGNGVRSRNLPMTPLPFRQDSTFLYFTGCSVPGASLLIVDGESVLFLPKPAEDDTLWHGAVASFAQMRVHFGVDRVRATTELSAAIGALPTPPVTLAIADERRNAWASELLNKELLFGRKYGDAALVDAVIRMRRSKTAEELDLLRQAAKFSADAHLAVAAATRPGVHERALAALFEAVAAARGCSLGYPTILTQRGEILHNFRQTDLLAEGALLLVDGGGEVGAGYGVDITRTWPVSGQFTARQRGAYEAVLQAQVDAIARCRVGVRYREVHDIASLGIARFLADEGIVRCDPQSAVEAGAHALFFPHGTGHLLGMDVHDLENFGDLSSYPPGQARPEQFGTCYLRLDLPLEAGWVVTVEPGFYVVPAILADAKLRDRFRGMVDFDAAEKWLGFGGIRIEDDIAVTAAAPEVLTSVVPSAPDDVERLVGCDLSIGVVVNQDSMRGL